MCLRTSSKNDDILEIHIIVRIPGLGYNFYRHHTRILAENKYPSLRMSKDTFSLGAAKRDIFSILLHGRFCATAQKKEKTRSEQQSCSRLCTIAYPSEYRSTPATSLSQRKVRPKFGGLRVNNFSYKNSQFYFLRCHCIVFRKCTPLHGAAPSRNGAHYTENVVQMSGMP